MSARTRLALWIAVAALSTTAAPAEAKRHGKPCVPGRFIVAETDAPLIASDPLVRPDTVVLGTRDVAIGSGCATVPARIRTTRTATRLKARWTACGRAEKVHLTGKIASPACDRLVGKVKGRQIPAHRFTALRSHCGDHVTDAGNGEACDGTVCPNGLACTDDCVCPPTTTTTLPSGLLETCPPNPEGGPYELDFEVAAAGTDLDHGWTGLAHNHRVDPRAALKLCLSGCDAATDPICDAYGPTGEGTLNGPTFGPPLPLINHDVPICVVQEHHKPIAGVVNVRTGEIPADQPLQLDVFADAYYTFPAQVCPRCVGPATRDYGDPGTCDGGPQEGEPCVVESIVVVPLADGDTRYQLSSSCVPFLADLAGRREVRLQLTTGTSTLTGSAPCQADPGEPIGVKVEDDACNGAPCSAACTGSACVGRDDQDRCLDEKGGISQVCCASDSTRPCFPTAAGSLERTGNASPARDVDGLAWPDGAYPKAAPDGVLVSTFCEGATHVDVINESFGLPGPGALVLPVTQRLR